MQLKVDEFQVLRLLAGYLREKKCFETLASLSLELNLSLSASASPELLQVQRLVLQGRWDDVTKLLLPVMDAAPALGQRVKFLLSRQRYLETLIWLGGGCDRMLLPPWKPVRNPKVYGSELEEAELDDLIDQLNQLKNLCSMQQFNSLCLFLTLSKLEDHPDYASWTVAEGRVRCCEELQLLLGPVLAPALEPTEQIESDSFRRLLALFLMQYSPASGESRDSKVESLSRVVSDAWSQSEDALRIVFSPVAHPICRVQPNAAAVLLIPSEMKLEVKPDSDGQSFAFSPQVVLKVANNGGESRVEKFDCDQNRDPPNIVSSPATAGKVKTAVAWTVEHGESTNDARPKSVSAHSRRQNQLESKSSNTQLQSEPWGGAKLSESVSRKGNRQDATVTEKTVEENKRDVVIDCRGLLLYQTNCPLRCAVHLRDVQHVLGETDSQYFALGTNAKEIQCFHYSSQRLAAFVQSNQMVGSDTREPMDCSGCVRMEQTLSNVHKGSVYALDWSSQHQLLASGSNDKYVKLCRPPFTNELVHSLRGHTGTIRVVKFAATVDSPWLASAGAGDCKTRIWDVKNLSALQLLKEHPACVHGLAWLDHNTVVTGCESGELMAHDLRSSQTPAWIFHLEPSKGSTTSRSIFSLSLLSSSCLGIGANNGYFLAFDLRQQRIRFDSQLHREDIRAMAINAPNNILLTSSYDSEGCLWKYPSVEDEFSMNKLASLSGGHKDKILSTVLFASHRKSGNDTITTGADGRAILWQVMV